jgi:hypothetical protein
MTKRANNLILQIADIDNIVLAFWKAKRGREMKEELKEFTRKLDANLLKIHNGVIEGNIELGNYHYFKIHDPKERVICAASFPERVLHHAIMNICDPVFEQVQLFDSYATRVHKGQYAGLDRAKGFQNSYRWFCKLDIRKYFDSIDHNVLKNKLRHKFKDVRLLDLFDRIIDSYEVTPGKGIPIGNLTSQYFANYYLSFADHFLKETIHVPAYVRYMDDMVLWHSDLSQLLEIKAKFVRYIENELKLKVKPDCTNGNEKGLPFLGYVLFPNSFVRMNKHTKCRFASKFRKYSELLNNGSWSEKEFANHVTPIFAFAQYADTLQYRKKLILKVETGQGALTV